MVVVQARAGGILARRQAVAEAVKAEVARAVVVEVVAEAAVKAVPMRR